MQVLTASRPPPHRPRHTAVHVLCLEIQAFGFSRTPWVAEQKKERRIVWRITHDMCRGSKFRPLAQATANREAFRVSRTFIHSPAPRRCAWHAAPGRLSMRLGGRTRPSWRRSSLAVRLPARRLAPQLLGPAAAPWVWIPLFSFRPSQLCLDANRRAISEPRPVGVANSVIPSFNCFREGPTGLPRPSRWPSAS